MPLGAIAQMGERLNGIQEVSGSIPLGSTKTKRRRVLASTRRRFAFVNGVCEPPAPAMGFFVLASFVTNAAHAVASTRGSEKREKDSLLISSLRSKLALAILFSLAVVMVPAALFGWRALDAVQENLGTAYARNVTQFNKQRLLTPVLRELAMAQRFADSETTRRFLLDEKNPVKRELFFAEAERYRKAFDEHSYFLASAISHNYYFNDEKSSRRETPRYVLHPNDPDEKWFFNTLRDTENFNLNVDTNPKLKATKVWFNVIVKDGNRKIGIAGSGLNLSGFLDRFANTDERGVTPMILNKIGAIQAHPGRKLIDYHLATDKGEHSLVYRLLPEPRDRDAMREALATSAKNPENIQLLWAKVGGKRELLATTFIPELQWYVVTAVDLQAARVLDNRLWISALLIGALLLILLLAGIAFATNRILLAPLLKLTTAARGVAAGDYARQLPAAGADELGELTRTFGAMASQVESHTRELESKVQERTRELVSVNRNMAAANKQIGDSIQYAKMIQDSILPAAQIGRALGENCFVLFRPRDVVGGDYYLFHEDESGYLIGVVDCAGHGVPGAFMTMMAHSALASSIEKYGLSNPAALLTEMDARLRSMLQDDAQYSRVATHMDVALAFVENASAPSASAPNASAQDAPAPSASTRVTFSGAKLSLYWCDENEVHEIKGGRRTVGDRRAPTFENAMIDAPPNRTFYITTDGLLDQAGGPKGLSFGTARFAELLKKQGARPMRAQGQAFAEMLQEYQGALPQRDDILALGFRIPSHDDKDKDA